MFIFKPPEKVAVGIGDTLTLNCSATGDRRLVISWKRQGAALPVGRSHSTNNALVLRDLKEEDAGNYICVATSAGVFDIETISDVQVGTRGKLCIEKFHLLVRVLDYGYLKSKLAGFFICASNQSLSLKIGTERSYCFAS